MIRVLLADDQALLRSTFRMLIDAEDDMTVVAEAANGEEAVELARADHPDLVLMDIRMPVLDGLAATRQICSDPDLAGTRVLILTTFESDEHVAHALRAGASGFLGKDVTPAGLLDGIRTVVAGDALLSPAATRVLIDRFLSSPDGIGDLPRGLLPTLTDREREITELAAHGLSNQQIADRLIVSPLTVRTHVHRAMMKLGARDRAQLVVIAYQEGLARRRGLEHSPGHDG
ncbi:response regulator transcription factor [Modestobacter sp. VKM Ac-2979]|uniref:response regulator n=1 Tax=unclassified Modestobacter TaxID=2643866 RepID=UPI0022AB5A65|nr:MULTISPECIES: response regulator transcription factor [unclassified Modestobacter]MCZ2811949.1 response regulator transcription factor [Modestobacter sp. VKM Ac-2979]MCZ2843672.1 response regulator transcription factor [Modestobacter sp. VKM Ac-2980]